ncbi:SDR family NAD(P)-dependent oxidoreductase [Curvivirga aplysinae]|uniref:SDR family NAD(P)-dependent oxidoreductase n=1 Tax=Curvivirga aplysinae TaxID=2529852 RepID=UPI0012BC02BF|nr:SDR family oxidoreductase [Curvivirga aplysinae]MTI11042.1 SDR family oxidoreductase [Curvivirga aplysinae]
MRLSDQNLSGKNVLITGGGSGVGAALAVAFVNAGATVVIAGRRLEVLEKTAVYSSAITPIVADVTNESSVADLFKTAGQQDVVVANAGAAETAPFGKVSLDSWDRMIAVNLTGVFLTLQAGLNQMNGWGRLISVASTAGLKGYPYVSAYTAAKHGVVGLTKSLALEVANKEITANALCPGFLDTEMTEKSVENIVEKTGMTSEQAKLKLAEHNPQQRLIRPEEVAATALWLCGAGSESINGQAISISGGEV